MRAMYLARPGSPLELREVAPPAPGPGELRVRVTACGICRTDLHIVDAELREPKLPLVLGHEIVGRVDAHGPGVTGPPAGTRVGIPWLGRTCGVCLPCRAGRENLCDAPLFTGYTRDGGFAEYAVADAGFCFRIPDAYGDLEAAPLLCAGLIGYRTLRMAGDARAVGIYGFGAAAHIVAQICRAEGREVYAFTRAGDSAAQALARRLGAAWAGGSEESPPAPLDAALIFAPVGALVPRALTATRKGGTVVCGGIHMSDIPSFPYSLLWEERVVRSIANLTREDGHALMQMARDVPIHTEITRYALEEAGTALEDMRSGRLTGAAVLDLAAGSTDALASAPTDRAASRSE
jgi:alcohol dehydrogenase, propanol-preferring